MFLEFVADGGDPGWLRLGAEGRGKVTFPGERLGVQCRVVDFRVWLSVHSRSTNPAIGTATQSWEPSPDGD